MIAGDVERLPAAHRQRAHVVIGVRDRGGDDSAASRRDGRTRRFLDHFGPALGVQLLEVHPHLGVACHLTALRLDPALRTQQRNVEHVPARALIMDADINLPPRCRIDEGFAAGVCGLCQRSKHQLKVDAHSV